MYPGKWQVLRCGHAESSRCSYRFDWRFFNNEYIYIRFEVTDNRIRVVVYRKKCKKYYFLDILSILYKVSPFLYEELFS